jgi:hypothetical protein
MIQRWMRVFCPSFCPLAPNLPPARPLEWVPAIFVPGHPSFEGARPRVARRQGALRALMGLSRSIRAKYHRKLGKEIAEMK